MVMIREGSGRFTADRNRVARLLLLCAFSFALGACGSDQSPVKTDASAVPASLVICAQNDADIYELEAIADLLFVPVAGGRNPREGVDRIYTSPRLKAVVADLDGMTSAGLVELKEVIEAESPVSVAFVVRESDCIDEAPAPKAAPQVPM